MAVLEVVGGWWRWWRRLRRSNDDDWQKWGIFVSLRGLVASKPRTNERQREKDNDHDQRKKGRWAWGMQWLKWSRSLRGTGAYLKHQLAEIAQDLGDKGHQNRIKAMLGGPSEEVVFSNFVRQDSWSASCWRIRSWLQQPDTTIETQLCSFGQIRRKQNAMMKYWPEKYEPCQYMNLKEKLLYKK